jgi:hypothetical protein
MFATRLYRRISDDRRKPLARYGAMESALRERLAPEVLHHQLGHDLINCRAMNFRFPLTDRLPTQ